MAQQGQPKGGRHASIRKQTPMQKLIFTDHAAERMYLRGVSEELVQSTVDKHDSMKKEDDGDLCFIRNVPRGGQKRNVHVITKPLPDAGKNALLVKTVWVRGEDDPNFIMKAFRMFIWHMFMKKKKR